AIAGAAVLRELGKGRARHLLLAAFGEGQRRLEGSAGFGRLLVLPPVVAAPAAHREHDNKSGGNNQVAVPLPELLQLLAPDFLVDFLENIRHFNALRPGLKVVSGGAAPSPAPNENGLRAPPPPPQAGGPEN